VGTPSFPGVVEGKGGVFRPRFGSSVLMSLLQ
jgi:hypothetical protein